MARELHVSRQAVHDLVKRGILQKDADGKIDVEKAKLALLNSVRPSGKTAAALQDFAATAASQPAPPSTAPLAQPLLTAPDQDPEITNYHIAKTLREAAEAQIARLKLDEMRGKFLVKDDFERHLFNAGRMLRDTLTNCARRIGAEVSGLNTAEECEAVIDREHRAALASFAQQLRHTLRVEVETGQHNSEAA